MATYLGFEILDMSVLNVDHVGRRAGILTAKYAGDYRDSINVDPPGVRSGYAFTLSAGVWAADEEISGVGGVSAWDYYWGFFNDRLDAGNEPFILEWKEKYWLVDLAEPEIGAECHTSDLFTPSGISVRRRAVGGVDFNPDGSMVTPEPFLLTGGGDFLLGDGDELMVMMIPE